ncbi:MAG: glycosyltransferase family 4 protein [Propionibacteriaceae bacterium]|nr:glycosyltransferase family 4 protein [Propionibacteriaceae bacterium]
MRIVFFTGQYLPTAGGVERYTDSLAREIAAAGHEVVVVASRLPGTPARETTGGVQVERWPARLFMGGRFPVPRRGAEFAASAAALWRRPIDLAVINTRFWALSLWAARQCRRRGTPAIVIEHGSGPLSLGRPAADAAVHLYERLAMAWVRRHVSSFYGVSKASAEWLGHFGVEAAGVLHNAVFAAALRGEAAETEWDARSEWGWPADAQLVVFVGRLIPEKGIRELLAAFERLRQSHRGVRLVLVGDGPLGAALAAQPGAGVHLAGLLPHREVLALLRQADVFCLPSYSEGFSTVVLEAAAVGVAMVTTPVGGTTELVLDAGYGLLLPDLKPATIAESLAKALDDPAWRTRAVELCRNRVDTEFTWAKTAERLLAIASARGGPRRG